MKVVHMKRTKADKKAQEKAYDKPSIGGEDYHYGHRLSLDDEHLDKLGITSMPKVGSKHRIEAHAHVVSTSQDEHNGGKRRRMELQITHLGVKPHEPNSAVEAVEKGIEVADNDGDD